MLQVDITLYLRSTLFRTSHPVYPSSPLQCIHCTTACELGFSNISKIGPGHKSLKAWRQSIPRFLAHILYFRGKEKIPIFYINSPVFPRNVSYISRTVYPVSKQKLLQQFQTKLFSISDHNIACLVFNFIANQYFPSCLMIHSCNKGT